MYRERTLGLNTRHVSLRGLHWLRFVAQDEGFPIRLQNGSIRLGIAGGRPHASIPPCVAKCMALAQEASCEWILFREDTTVLTFLPLF